MDEVDQKRVPYSHFLRGILPMWAIILLLYVLIDFALPPTLPLPILLLLLTLQALSILVPYGIVPEWRQHSLIFMAFLVGIAVRMVALPAGIFLAMPAIECLTTFLVSLSAGYFLLQIAEIVLMLRLMRRNPA